MKPENVFINAINKKLPDVWHEKMNNPYRSGTADVWYSGVKGDMWVEYKWDPHVPSDWIYMDVSANQQLWLNERRSEGRNVMLVVGAADRMVYILSHWEHLHLKKVPIHHFQRTTRERFAQDIHTIVGERYCLTKLAGASRTS